jgi:thioredoxin 1
MPAATILLSCPNDTQEVPMAREFTAANFKTDVLASDTPVLVDFWAPWCGPCRMVGPVVDKVGHDLAGSLTVGKVNIDDHPVLAEAFEVTSIPTLILFKGGRIAGRVTGFRGEPQLKEFVRAASAA